ncbi:hypothetical protein FMUAM8_29140 [Nocardia cyriacigeorgica]|nr:hypothetical protein FMUAM8_29140 [Nocardia cyriacigeorgica]
MLGTTSPHPDRSRLTARIRWSQAPKTAPTTDWVSVDLYQSEVAGIAEGERPGDEGEDVRGIGAATHRSRETNADRSGEMNH